LACPPANGSPSFLPRKSIRHTVFLGRRTIDRLVTYALLAQNVDGAVDFGGAHFEDGALDFDAGQIAQLDFRINLENSGELEMRRAFVVFGSMLGLPATRNSVP
jgi:hypothetical protein